MTVDKDFVLEALLRHNYLPTQRKASEELPPIFTTRRLTADIAFKLAEMEPRKGDYSGYDQIEYRMTRFNYVSRPLSIPHPLPHSRLCLCIRDCWEHLGYIVANPCSGIKPQKHADGRLIIMDYDDSLSKSRRTQKQAFGNRFKVHSDVSNCFPSIYSHAVPWALLGFDEAKAKKSHKHKDEWFNKLDETLRLTKRNETQGIAIGPATSNVISEIILARIDEVLVSKGHQFQRYIDDYTCYCESEEKAQDFIRQLSAELSRFKLMLNIKKTEVRKLPEPMADDWIISITSAIPSGKSIDAYQAIHFLEYALALSNKYPEGSVMKFAMKTLTKKPLDLFAKFDVLDYGLGLAFHQPFLLPLLDRALADTWLISQFDAPVKLNAIVREHAKLHRSDGMAWGLYLLGKHDAAIEESTADFVIETADAMSIAVLHWTGQYPEKVKAFVDSIVASGDLYRFDAYWLLLYEAFRDGVIPNPYPDEVFPILKDGGVYFLADESTIAADDLAGVFPDLTECDDASPTEEEVTDPVTIDPAL